MVRQTNLCLECGRPFAGWSGKKFCEKKCAHRHNRRKNYKPVKRGTQHTLICVGCNSEFITRWKHQKYCKPECRVPDDVTRFRIFERDGFRCFYCGAKALDGNDLHADHVQPISKGGEDAAYNLVSSCGQCNLEKHARLMPADLIIEAQAEARRRNARAGISDQASARVNRRV